MASTQSSIDTHPQRQKIIDALSIGTPFRDISAWTVPAVSTAALSRYRKRALDLGRNAINATKVSRAYNDAHLSPVEASAVTRAAMQAISSPFRSQLERLREITFRTLERAEQSGDVNVLAPLIGQGHKNTELLGRATGELTAGDQNVTNVMVVMPNTSTQPSSQPDDILTIDIGPK